MNGGRAFTNDIQLDGLPITGAGFNEAAILPNQEGLQEVRVISNNFTADYGHGQAVLEMTTKSGTNAFHGQVNYLMRNDGLNANSFSNNQLGIPRQALLMNNVGGAITGPIWKNKLFFFSSLHYLEYNNGVSNLITVPTALERVGNFTQTMQKGANGQPSPAQIFDPYVVQQIGANLYQRAPITPAIITPSLLPDPSAFGTPDLINNNLNKNYLMRVAAVKALRLRFMPSHPNHFSHRQRRHTHYCRSHEGRSCRIPYKAFPGQRTLARCPRSSRTESSCYC